jgi:hypothetical protein
MSVLPVGYYNSTNAYFEKNSSPDPINVIQGSDGIVVSRNGDTITLSLSAVQPEDGGDIIVKSSDGTQMLQISQSNSGIATIAVTGQINLTSQSSSIVVSNELFVADKLTVQPSNPTAAANLTIANGSNNANYGIFVASESEEGLIENDLMIYGYPSTGGNFLIMDANVQGTAIELGSTLAPDGCNVQINGVEGPSRVFDSVYNKPSSAATSDVSVAPAITGTGTATPATLRLLFLNAQNQIVSPSTPLVRWFSITTPSATNSPITIQDPDGNKYGNDWICSVAGFFNSSGDRTYNAWTFPPFANTGDTQHWGVQYDNAGSGTCKVWILAISTQLTGYVDYNV